MTTYFDITILIPVLTFFAFDRPHDCFSCLSMDPDHTYSIFQFSLEERVRRKMVAKYSKVKDRSQTADQSFIKHLLENHTSRRFTDINSASYYLREEQRQITNYNDEDLVYQFGGSLRDTVSSFNPTTVDNDQRT